MSQGDKSSLSPRERLLRVFAYVSLLAAFIVGQIANKTDYQELLQQQMPDAVLVKSEQRALPVVFHTEDKSGEISEDAVVMADGVGYGGPMVVGVRARRTDEGARISEILVLSHKETAGYQNRINRANFFRQFAGKSVTDSFLIGADIDAVTGATVSSQGYTEAIREAVHLGAAQHLDLEPSWQTPDWRLGMEELILTALFALAIIGAYRRDKLGKYLRLGVMTGALVFVGFYYNAAISLGQLAGIVLGYIPHPKLHPVWWIMMIGALGCVIVLGRNIYCHQICPFLVVQKVLQRISGVSLRLKPSIQRQARKFVFSMSWIALMLIFLSAHPALGSYEPFAMIFSLEGVGIQWYILPASLLGALFVPNFWCRLFCPVGLFLNEGVRARRTIRDKLVRKKPLTEASVLATDAMAPGGEIDG